MSKVKFTELPVPKAIETAKMITFSTAHITEDDGKLIGYCSAPGHWARLDPLSTPDDSPGDVFHLLSGSHTYTEVWEYGFSVHFVALWDLACRTGHQFMRLDRDGPVHEELPVFNW